MLSLESSTHALCTPEDVLKVLSHRKLTGIWVQYDAPGEENPIKHWYCQCKSGVRLGGGGADVASILW